MPLTLTKSPCKRVYPTGNIVGLIEKFYHFPPGGINSCFSRVHFRRRIVDTCWVLCTLFIAEFCGVSDKHGLLAEKLRFKFLYVKLDSNYEHIPSINILKVRDYDGNTAITMIFD